MRKISIPKVLSAFIALIYVVTFLSMKIWVIFLCLPGTLFSQEPSRYCLVITEIMADPLPVVSLPAYEYLELYNRSTDSIDLFKWKIVVGNDTAIFNKHVILAPDAYLIISGNAGYMALQPFGTVAGLSNFPSLNNDGELIQLLSADDKVIHATEFSGEWYDTNIKRQGGWSLEMVNSNLPCNGSSNWKASLHTSGGTPGIENSVSNNTTDDKPPSVVRTYMPDSSHVVAVFDEPLDSTEASDPQNYILDHSIGVVQVLLIPPLYNQVKLTLSKPLQAAVVHKLTVRNVKDCYGNEIGFFNQVPAGLPEKVAAFDIVINEILFNPPSGGSDFIELYNRSTKIMELQHLYLSSKDLLGGFVQPQRIQQSPFLLFPGQFFVLTENKIWTCIQYHVKHPEQLSQLLTLPSLPDDKGTIALVTVDGSVIDEISYSAKWHHPLLVNVESVSLERINYNHPSQNATNWSSASFTSGFATPTYQNSQLNFLSNADQSFKIDPPVFSPDHDGWQDFVFIHYVLDVPGYMGTVTIYNANGAIVRSLVTNVSLSSTGLFKWDGLNNENQRLPSGIYIISMDVFNLAGKRKKFRKAVTLAIGFE